MRPDVRNLPLRERERLHQEANRLRNEGQTYEAIAQALGVAQVTAYRWCNPEFDARERERSRLYAAKRRAQPQTAAAEAARNRENQRRRREKLKLAKEKERQLTESRQTVREFKGTPSEIAYSHLRKALQLLEAAIASDAVTVSERRWLREAQASLHSAEDALHAAGRMRRAA